MTRAVYQLRMLVIELMFGIQLFLVPKGSDDEVELALFVRAWAKRNA